MKTTILSLLLLIFSINALPQTAGDVFLADPTITYYDGTYYLSGTEDAGRIKGFGLYESKDLQSWSIAGQILIPGQHCWGTKGFWAPQFVHYGKKWLFLYTANEQVVMAQSDKITGPFTQKKVKPVDMSAKNIDPFLFIDDDGKAYLYHVRFDHGNYIWCGEYNISKGKIVPGTLKRCFSVTQQWEDTKAYPSDPIMEGPGVIKLYGKYYLFYSANHFMSKDYAVGYAVADSPYGPWVKYSGNPIINTSIMGENGCGHGDVFKGAGNQLYYVYHVHNSKSKATPRRTRIVPLIVTKGEDGICTFKADKDKVIIPHFEK